MTRRTFLLVPVALAAQPARPRIEIAWTTANSVPDEFARESVVFPRAYTACPATGLARRALETGRFPHAGAPGNPTLASILGNVGSSPNTITVLTSESGDGEDSSSQRSVHVPLAIRWPGTLAPRVTNVLISHVDVMPTLLAMCGVPTPEGAQGRDLSALILRREGESPDSVYCEGRIGKPDEWRVLVRGFDKLVFNPQQEEATHLYNLADDPGEENDLVRNRENELTRDAMLALAKQWMRKLSDGRDASGLRLRN